MLLFTTPCLLLACFLAFGVPASALAQPEGEPVFTTGSVELSRLYTDPLSGAGWRTLPVPGDAPLPGPMFGVEVAWSEVPVASALTLGLEDGLHFQLASTDCPGTVSGSGLCVVNVVYHGPPGVKLFDVVTAEVDGVAFAYQPVWPIRISPQVHTPLDVDLELSVLDVAHDSGSSEPFSFVVVLRNNGRTPAAPPRVRVVPYVQHLGSMAEHWRLSGQTCAWGALEPGQACRIDVDVQAGVPGLYRADVHVESAHNHTRGYPSWVFVREASPRETLGQPTVTLEADLRGEP